LRTHASRRPGVPATLTLAGREAHEAALQRDQAAHRPCIRIRQVQELTNVVEQDHRAVKRVTRPRLGCNAFDTTQATRAGIARMPRLKNRPLVVEGGAKGLTAAEPGDMLAT
jgi:transposase-like protein